MKPGTREEDRQTEDDIARKNLGPRGVPGAPDTAKMTLQEDKNTPSPASLTVTPPRQFPPDCRITIAAVRAEEGVSSSRPAAPSYFRRIGGPARTSRF
jgi:hypothetical protein